MREKGMSEEKGGSGVGADGNPCCGIRMSQSEMSGKNKIQL